MFAGSVEDAKKYVGPLTFIHDYGKNFIYPGFIDGHSHMGLLATVLIDGAMMSADYPLRQDAEVMKQYIEEHPGKTIYKGLGFWLHEDDEDKPTHAVLDKYASDQVPILTSPDWPRNVESADMGCHSAFSILS